MAGQTDRYPSKTRIIALRIGALFLFPARIFGWVFLIYFGWRDRWIKPVVLMGVAFPLSLLMQSAPVHLLRGRHSDVLDSLMTMLGFVVLPVCAVLMVVLLPAR